ncbi:MAG: ATP-binding protein, partial [Steroidobacteraceae bacterium]
MQTFSITEASGIAHARRAVTALAGTIGFSEEDAGRASIVATEICGNIFKHGGGGELLVQVIKEDGSHSLELIGLDKGRGMSDVERCLRDGFSTGGSPGTGLGAIERLSQVFDLYSQPDKGTAVVARLSPQSRPPRRAGVEMGSIVVAAPGESECGDAWCYAERSGGPLVLAVDGLGHGLAAAQVARAACDVFEAANKDHGPKALLQQVHTALRPTRGAAVALLDIDWSRNELLAAGIGNLLIAIATHAGMKRVPSYNGIVGRATLTIRELAYPIEPASVVITHSDGLTAGWQIERYPGLLRHHAAVIAGVLYRDCKRGRDDSMV